MLLLADDQEKEFKTGDVVRFADIDVLLLLLEAEDPPDTRLVAMRI